MVGACALDPAADSTVPTGALSPTTSITTTSTTTTTVPARRPAEITSYARFPDDTSLQDGIWAALVFYQPLECLPPDADLIDGVPSECDLSVVFTEDGSENLIGEDVPVWLFRWPVLSYALANGTRSLEHLRSLPTLVETTSESYEEDPGVLLEISGQLPDGGDYEIHVSETTTIAMTPVTEGEPVVLSDLSGHWESETSVLQVDEGGSYELFEIQLDGAVEEAAVQGFIALQDGLLIFVTNTNPGPCPGETGVYFGEIRGEMLHLSAVDEPCAFREEAFEAPWSQTESG
jgi:hypothetical protein